MVLHPAIDEQIVRGHAGLAAVEQLAEYQPLGSQVQLGGGVHHAGAFAPQLQGDGGEVAGRLGHDLPPHGHPAGKKDIVKFLVQQGLVFRPASLYHTDEFRGKALRQDGADEVGGGGGVG